MSFWSVIIHSHFIRLNLWLIFICLIFWYSPWFVKINKTFKKIVITLLLIFVFLSSINLGIGYYQIYKFGSSILENCVPKSYILNEEAMADAQDVETGYQFTCKVEEGKFNTFSLDGPTAMGYKTYFKAQHFQESCSLSSTDKDNVFQAVCNENQLVFYNGH